MSFSRFKESWGYQEHEEIENGDNNNNNMNKQSTSKQFRQTTIPSPTSSRDGTKTVPISMNAMNSIASNKSEPHDFIFLRVKNWSSCSRCLWHLEHLLNEKIDICRNKYRQYSHIPPSPFIEATPCINAYIDHEASPFIEDTPKINHDQLLKQQEDERDASMDEAANASIGSLSPLRLNATDVYRYPTNTTNKKCGSSPLTPPRFSPHFGATMVKSRSLPNITDATPNMDSLAAHVAKENNHLSPNPYASSKHIHHSPLLSHHIQYSNKYQFVRRDRMCEIDKKLVALQCLDNVEAVGYGSISSKSMRECKDNNHNNMDEIIMTQKRDKDRVQLSQTTSLRFLYESYRIVITLDISSSVGVMNPTTRCITFEHYYPMLRDFLLLISQPMDFECLATPIFPTLYICIIAVGLPSKPMVLLLKDEIKCDYNTTTIDNMIKRLYDEFQKLQTNIVQQLRETHSSADDKRLNVDWEDIIHHSLFCLDRMPAIGCPNIVVITDGMLSLENCTTTYGAGVLAQVLRRDVSVNTLQTTQRQFSPNAPFGHVPDSDLLEFFCRFTNGILVDHKTLHQQYEARFGEYDIDNDQNIEDRYNKTLDTMATNHCEYEKAAMFSQFHHFKHKKNLRRSSSYAQKVNIDHDIDDEEEDIDDDYDYDSDINMQNDATIKPVDVQTAADSAIKTSVPAKWFRNKVDSLFKGDNLVQLGVLVRSSSLSNQVFESTASSMLASWTNLVQTQARKRRHRSMPMMHTLPDPLLMGHFERVPWYKTSYIVNLSRSVLIRARTNEGFKNANIICKGDYSYYNHGQYASINMDNMDTASVNSNDSRYPLENNQIIHMFHEWKHRVVIEYQMIFSVPCINEYEPIETRVNIYIIGSISFLTNLVKYLAQKDKTQNIRSQQFAELQEFIQDIKRMDKALSNLVFDKEVMDQANKKRKFSSLLNYLEQKIWHDVVFQDVICVPKQHYMDLYTSHKQRNYKIKTWIENLQINTPNVWQKVRDALKEWSTFDLEYNDSEIIKFVRSFHEYGGFAVVVFEQLHECDWLVSLKIEAQGPVSRRIYRLVKDSVTRLIQQTVSLDQYRLQFLNKPIHDLLLFDFNDVTKCNGDDTNTNTPVMTHTQEVFIPNRGKKYIDSNDPYYLQEIQLIRAYLHTYCWFISIPSKSYVRNVMSMFTDLKLREGFSLILNHSTGRILGYWIYPNNNNTEQTSFVQIILNKLSKGLLIELAVEPTSCKYTFGTEYNPQLSTKDILSHLKTWTHRNIQKIISIVSTFYASSRTIKEIRMKKLDKKLETLRSNIAAKTVSTTYNSESESDDQRIHVISNKPSLVSTPQPSLMRQGSGSRLSAPSQKRKSIKKSLRKRKKSSKAKIGLSKSKQKKTLKGSATPKAGKLKGSDTSPLSIPVSAQQSVVFDFKKKQSILSNEDVFKGCDIRYKAKLNEIALHGTETRGDFATLFQNESTCDKVEKHVLEPLDVMLEILQHSDVNHRVFSYELDYHQQILNDENIESDVTKSRVSTSAQLLLQLLLKTVKSIADIEIINERVYCYDITPSKDTVIDSHNLLYIVLPSKMHPIPALDAVLSQFKPIGENYSDYLYLFEVSRQIISTTSSSLYDEKDYGIIADIMRYIPCKKAAECASDSNTGTPSLSAITPRSMLDHCLSRLRQNHARNKARIIYYDLINQINVPLNRIEFAINKCCQFREDFNISLLKKLMIAEFDIKNTQNPTKQTTKFADKLLAAVEATCKAQFKYIPELDAYFYIPMDYKHKFVDECITDTKCVIDEEEELRDQIHNSSSANDADYTESLDEDNQVLEGSDSSDEDHVNDDIPQSESEKLKTTTLSAQEKRMHRRAKLRVRKPGTLSISQSATLSIGRENAFNSILPDIYTAYNQTSDSMLMQIDHTSSAPPPEAFASPFDNPLINTTSIITSVRYKRSFSSPIGAASDALSTSSLSITQNTLPYPLFIRFNVIIHGTANRFRSVSVNDIKKEAIYTQQCSAICLNAIIMTTPPSSVSMGLDTNTVSLEDINSLSMDQFNESPFMHCSQSMTSLNINDNNMVPALDTKNIYKLPVMFVGLYRQFSRKLRAQIARIVLHQLRSSKPVNSEMVLQHLSLLELNQYHLFSQIVRFIDKQRCFDLLPLYMAKSIVPDITVEKVNLNFSPFHKSHLWFAMTVDQSIEEGDESKTHDADAMEGMYENCSIPYWVFICISEDVTNAVNASFLLHIHPDDAALYKVQAIEKKFRDYMQRAQFLINQHALLQELNETKIINQFLIPIEENYNEANSKSIPIHEEPPNPADSAFDMFKPGQFEAKEQLILPFIIHRRVDPRQAKYHLEQILIRMRCGTTDIFVFRERSGNIFYFKCEVARFDQSYHINEETIIEQEHDDNQSTRSGADTQTPLTQSTGTSMIRFIFYGQTKPGEQITKELKKTLQDQLGDFTQRTMITLLQKNPKFLFNHIDYRFLCPSNGSPKESRCYPLPDFVSDLYLFTLFLKQNIAAHLGIHSIRITPDENRLAFDTQTIVSDDSKDHASPTPGFECRDLALDAFAPKSFRVKISSEDISFVYFTLPPLYKKRKYKQKQRKSRQGSIHSNFTTSGNNTTGLTVGTDSGLSPSSATNKRTRYPSSIFSLQNISTQHAYDMDSFKLSSASPQFDDDLVEEDPIYKLGQSFGNGLAVLTCGFITTTHQDYISHATTCINPIKTNDLTSMLINPDRSLKSLAFLLQNIQTVKPQSLDTIKGGHLREWKKTTSLLRQQLNALQQTEPLFNMVHSATPQPAVLMKHDSNSTFFGSASPREIETDYDSFCAAHCIEETGIMTDDMELDLEDQVTEEEDEYYEATEVEQRAFVIELWSRGDSAINTNQLLTQFNAAINQSLHEYAIEWLCVVFRNALLEEYARRDERICNMLNSYLLKPLLNIMSSSVRLSSNKMNFKCKTCHCFQHTFPRMFWGLNKTTKSVLLELSHTFPIMPLYVLTTGKSHKLYSRAQFMAANEDKHVFMDKLAASYIIVGGIRMFVEDIESTPLSRTRSSSERAMKHDKIYGPKRLQSTRSSLHRHSLFIGVIEPNGMKLYYYNVCLEKIKKFQSKMDQLASIIQERCSIFNSIMLNRMGLSSSFMGQPSQFLKPRSRTTSRESAVHLRSMKSAATVDSIESGSHTVFESLWLTPDALLDLEMDAVRGICGVSKRRLYELGIPAANQTEFISDSPMLISTSLPKISRSESASSLTSPTRLFSQNAQAAKKVNDNKQQRREENKKEIQPERKSYCITKDPMDVHFLITERRLKATEDKTLKLSDISKLMLRAKYLNELITDNSSMDWRSKREEFKQYGIKIHEVHCPFLIECIHNEQQHKLIQNISWTFISDLCKYLEKKLVTLHRLVDCLFYDFEMDKIARQIFIIPDLIKNEVSCTFYLLPETAITSCRNSNISERHSLQMQQEYLRNVLEDLQSTMWMDLNVFVSKWCKQWIIQILNEQFQCKQHKKDSIYNEMDAKQTIQRLCDSDEQILEKLAKIDITNYKNESVLLKYKMKIPKHRKYVNQKETKRNRKPLYEWFARYGFKTLHQKNVVFIVSRDYCFTFEGNRYSNKMYHSKLTETAIIVLMFSEENIDAFYLENNKVNSIKFVHNTSHNNSKDILKYLNAPFGVNEDNDNKLSISLKHLNVDTSHQMTVSATNTPNLMPISQLTISQSPSPLSDLLIFSNNDINTFDILSSRANNNNTKATLMKSFSLDIVNPLNESNDNLQKSEFVTPKHSKINEKCSDIITPLFSTSMSNEAAMKEIDKQKEDEMNDRTLTSSIAPSSCSNKKKAHIRRWSVSQNVEEIKCNLRHTTTNTEHGFDLKQSLIKHTMQVSLVEIVTDIVSLWYVLPDCELTFLSIIGSITLISTQNDDDIYLKHNNTNMRNISCDHNMYLSSIFNPLHVNEIDISRLKKLRKYYWRKPFKYVVQQFLAANSTKEQHALIGILTNLQSVIIDCDDSLAAFVSFIELCKNNEKMKGLTNAIEIIASLSPIHLFIYCHCDDEQQNELLIHFFLSQNNKANQIDGIQNNHKDNKLVMEVIGRTNPNKSVLNKQCLNDLIDIISLFLIKRKTHL